MHLCWHTGVVSGFQSGRLAHPESLNEDENCQRKKISKVVGNLRKKVERLPTRDCEAGYAGMGIYYFVKSQLTLPLCSGPVWAYDNRSVNL